MRSNLISFRWWHAGGFKRNDELQTFKSKFVVLTTKLILF